MGWTRSSEVWPMAVAASVAAKMWRYSMSHCLNVHYIYLLPAHSPRQRKRQRRHGNLFDRSCCLVFVRNCTGYGFRQRYARTRVSGSVSWRPPGLRLVLTTLRPPPFWTYGRYRDERQNRAAGRLGLSETCSLPRQTKQTGTVACF